MNGCTDNSQVTSLLNAVMLTSCLTHTPHTCTHMYIGATLFSSRSNTVLPEHASSWQPSTHLWWGRDRPIWQGAHQHRGIREFDELLPTSNHDPPTPLPTAAVRKPQHNTSGMYVTCMCTCEYHRTGFNCENLLNANCEFFAKWTCVYTIIWYGINQHNYWIRNLAWPD